MHKWFNFSTSLMILILCVCIYIYIYIYICIYIFYYLKKNKKQPNRCEVISHCGFDLHFQLFLLTAKVHSELTGVKSRVKPAGL